MTPARAKDVDWSAHCETCGVPIDAVERPAKVRRMSPTRIQTALAYLSLARTLRKLAHDYKRWAREAEADGNLLNYRHWRDCSDRAWDNARFYLRQARIS